MLIVLVFNEDEGERRFYRH